VCEVTEPSRKGLTDSPSLVAGEVTGYAAVVPAESLPNVRHSSRMCGYPMVRADVEVLTGRNGISWGPMHVAEGKVGRGEARSISVVSTRDICYRFISNQLLFSVHFMKGPRSFPRPMRTRGAVTTAQGSACSSRTVRQIKTPF
jgi:hypothetical protein